MEKKEFIEEMQKEIKKYKGIYSKRLLDYLQALLMLEKNVIKHTTYGKEKIEILKQIELFRRVVNYNIFEYTKRILQTAEINDLKADFEYDFLPILKANYYGECIFDSKFPIEGIESKKVIFTLNQTEVNEELRNQRIEELYLQYEAIKNKKNTYPGFISECEHEIELKKKLNSILKAIEQLKLRNKCECTSTQLMFSEKAKNVYELLEKEYGPFDDKPGQMVYDGPGIKKQKVLIQTPFVVINHSTQII